MIMVLSCFDFLQVVLWSTEEYDLLAMVQIYEHFSNLFIGFSIMALLVMRIERYLGAYYRTWLTRRRLLILLVILFIFPTILIIISINDMVISYPGALIIFFVTAFPPFIFFNYKLFKIFRKVRRDIADRPNVANRRDNSTSPDVSSLNVNLKNISTCLLAVGCLLLMYTPTFAFIAYSFAEKSTSENTKVVHFWASTVANANSTLNCLVFFWKNDVSRKEGVKVLKSLKDCLKCTWHLLKLAKLKLSTYQVCRMSMIKSS